MWCLLLFALISYVKVEDPRTDLYSVFLWEEQKCFFPDGGSSYMARAFIFPKCFSYGSQKCEFFIAFTQQMAGDRRLLCLRWFRTFLICINVRNALKEDELTRALRLSQKEEEERVRLQKEQDDELERVLKLSLLEKWNAVVRISLKPLLFGALFVRTLFVVAVFGKVHLLKLLHSKEISCSSSLLQKVFFRWIASCVIASLFDLTDDLGRNVHNLCVGIRNIAEGMLNR